MSTMIAWVRDNKILEIIPFTGKKDIERGVVGDNSRLVDITGQPWLKVGDYWGPDPTKWVWGPAGPPEKWRVEKPTPEEPLG